MLTATEELVDGARVQPLMVMLLVTAAPASGMVTRVALLPVQPPAGGVVGPVVGGVVGPVVGGVVPPVQVGSADWAGTLTAVQAALTVLKVVQLPGVRFLAAVSVQVRYFRYD